MRQFSKQEKILLKDLMKSRKYTCDLTDFLSADWPGGRFEVSTFQQSLSIQVTDDQLPSVMSHMVNRLNFIKALESEGYINTWSVIPTSDNTSSCGVAESDAKTIFVPDISVATELLKYANYQISISDSLKEWARKNFRVGRIFNPLAVSVYVLILLLIADLIYHAQGIQSSINQDHQNIVANNEEVLENQNLSNQIMDSLRAQNREMMSLTGEISVNTKNMKEVEVLIRKQQNTMNAMQVQFDQLYEQLGNNRKYLQNVDSVLNQLVKSES